MQIAKLLIALALVTTASWLAFGSFPVPPGLADETGYRPVVRTQDLTIESNTKWEKLQKRNQGKSAAQHALMLAEYANVDIQIHKENAVYLQTATAAKDAYLQLSRAAAAREEGALQAAWDQAQEARIRYQALAEQHPEGSPGDPSAAPVYKPLVKTENLMQEVPRAFAEVAKEIVGEKAAHQARMVAEYANIENYIQQGNNSERAGYAASLRQAALEIAARATAGQQDQTVAAIQETKTICDTCHARFRDTQTDESP